MRIETYAKYDQKLIEDWLSLWNNSSFANYANSPQWFLSTLETYEYNNYVIIAAYEEQNLKGIAAFFKERKYGVEIYTIQPENFACGLPFLIDFQNKILLKCFLDELLKLGSIYLKNFPEFLLNDLKKQTTKINFIYDTKNYYLNITKDYFGQVLFKHKNKLIHLARHLENKLKIKSFDNDMIKGLQIAYSIDIKSRKYIRGYNTFSDEQIKIYYQSLAKNYRENILINILYYDNIPIAYEIGFLVQKTFHCSQIATDKEYDKYSISRVFLIKLIEELGSKGVQKLDFGSGEDHVKKSFTKNYIPLYTLIISNNTLTRKYISLISQLNLEIYNYLKRHIKLYFIYRYIKKHLSFIRFDI